MQHKNEELAVGQVDSLDAYPDATEKLQVQEQRMQDEKDQLRRQLAKAFDKERMRANEQQLQFENEKARGNELRQMLEMHQL